MTDKQRKDLEYVFSGVKRREADEDVINLENHHD